jgi:hypothetical protein
LLSPVEGTVITRREVLQKWAKDWRTLKAWNRDLSEVQITISEEVHKNRWGTCWIMEQRLVVYKSPTIHQDLDTLIHELAHAATIHEAHGPDWQLCYATAIREVTGISIPKAADNYQILCEAGSAAVTSWWMASGHDFLWRLVSK